MRARTLMGGARGGVMGLASMFCEKRCCTNGDEKHIRFSCRVGYLAPGLPAKSDNDADGEQSAWSLQV